MPVFIEQNCFFVGMLLCKQIHANAGFCKYAGISQCIFD